MPTLLCPFALSLSPGENTKRAGKKHCDRGYILACIERHFVSLAGNLPYAGHLVSLDNDMMTGNVVKLGTLRG